MSFDKVVAHCDDLVDGKLGGGVGIQHCSLIDGVLLASNGSLDGQQLNVDVGAVHSGTDLGQIADICGLNTCFVNKAGNLNAGVVRQVGDKTVIYYVTADGIRLVGGDGLHNVRSVFVGTLGRCLNAVHKLLTLLDPSCLVSDAAARIFVKRDAVSVDKLGIFFLDEELVVLGVMLAGLGYVVAEAADVLKANKILKALGRIVEDLASAATDLGIQILFCFPQSCKDCRNRYAT